VHLRDDCENEGGDVASEETLVKWPVPDHANETEEATTSDADTDYENHALLLKFAVGLMG
jgi:hypothetical protein